MLRGTQPSPDRSLDYITGPRHMSRSVLAEAGDKRPYPGMEEEIDSLARPGDEASIWRRYLPTYLANDRGHNHGLLMQRGIF